MKVIFMNQSLEIFNDSNILIEEEEKNKLLSNIKVSDELKNDRLLFLNALSQNNKALPIDFIKNKVLRDNLIKYEISFQNHCTTSGCLMINYYFKLNGETKELLRNYKNDFEIDINSLEDLALYKDDELKFSSCTHEGFNSLN